MPFGWFPCIRPLHARIPDWFLSSCRFALSSSIFVSFEFSFWTFLIYVAVDSCNSSVVNGPLPFVSSLIQLLLYRSNHAILLIAFRKLNFWINKSKLSFCKTAAYNTSLIIFLLLSISGEGPVVIFPGYSSWFVNLHGLWNQFSDKCFSMQPLLPVFAGFCIVGIYFQVASFDLIFETLLRTNCL